MRDRSLDRLGIPHGGSPSIYTYILGIETSKKYSLIRRTFLGQTQAIFPPSPSTKPGHQTTPCSQALLLLFHADSSLVSYRTCYGTQEPRYMIRITCTEHRYMHSIECYFETQTSTFWSFWSACNHGVMKWYRLIRNSLKHVQSPNTTKGLG